MLWMIVARTMTVLLSRYVPFLLFILDIINFIHENGVRGKWGFSINILTSVTIIASYAMIA